MDALQRVRGLATNLKTQRDAVDVNIASVTAGRDVALEELNAAFTSARARVEAQLRAKLLQLLAQKARYDTHLEAVESILGVGEDNLRRFSESDVITSASDMVG